MFDKKKNTSVALNHFLELQRLNIDVNFLRTDCKKNLFIVFHVHIPFNYGFI